MPLMLEDGTLYGVLGIEMLDDYLCSHLPYGELGFDADGSYIVAQFDKTMERASVKVARGSRLVASLEPARILPSASSTCCARRL